MEAQTIRHESRAWLAGAGRRGAANPARRRVLQQVGRFGPAQFLVTLGDLVRADLGEAHFVDQNRCFHADCSHSPDWFQLLSAP